MVFLILFDFLSLCDSLRVSSALFLPSREQSSSWSQSDLSTLRDWSSKTGSWMLCCFFSRSFLSIFSLMALISPMECSGRQLLSRVNVFSIWLIWLICSSQSFSSWQISISSSLSQYFCLIDSILFNNIFLLLLLKEVRLLLLVVSVCDPLSFQLELPRVVGLPPKQITLPFANTPLPQPLLFSPENLDCSPRTISVDYSTRPSTMGCYFASTVIMSVEY